MIELNDAVYKRILEKFHNGTFTMGNKLVEEKRYSSAPRKLKENYKNALTPEIRVFYTYNFLSDLVMFCVRENPQLFDRQFYKDLIVTNPNSLVFHNNCFEMMPLEYIDEEMCSIAILNSTDWSGDKWFYTVLKRKPEALTGDLWKLGARFYSRMVFGANKFLQITPECYKDKEYYFEMCSCNFYNSSKSLENKGQILQTIPNDMLDSKFLLSLLENDLDNVVLFPDNMLDKDLIYFDGYKVIKEKVWQYAIRKSASSVQLIPLNEERASYFMKMYSKNSYEYQTYFKELYKEYMREKRDFSALLKIKNIQRTEFNFLNTYSSNSYSSKKIEKKEENPITNFAILPKKCEGAIPEGYELSEYTKFLYELMGIQVVSEYDDLFFKVVLPESWKIHPNGYWYYVKDENENVVIHYLYYKKEFAKDAYVKSVNISKEKLERSAQFLARKLY